MGVAPARDDHFHCVLWHLRLDEKPIDASVKLRVATMDNKAT